VAQPAGPSGGNIQQTDAQVQQHPTSQQANGQRVRDRIGRGAISLPRYSEGGNEGWATILSRTLGSRRGGARGRDFRRLFLAELDFYSGSQTLHEQ
jgi:hypothetical protein